MTLLTARTDDNFQGKDLMERNAATDVEETRHLRVFAFHGKIAVTGDEDDPVDGVLDRAAC